MVEKWSSLDGLVRRTIQYHRSDCVDSTEQCRVRRPVYDGDACSIMIGDITGSELVSGWLANAGSDGTVELHVGMAETWLDRLLEMCLLTLCVGDCARAEFSRSPRSLDNDCPDDVVSCQLTVVSAADGCTPELRSIDQLILAADRSRQLAGKLYSSTADRSQDAFCQYRRCLQFLLLAEQRLLRNARSSDQSEQQNIAQLSELTGRMTVCRANICACLSRSKRHQATVDSATRVLASDGDHLRCLHRRASSRLQLKLLPQAGEDISRMLKLEPENTAALKLLKQLQYMQQKADQVTAGFMRRYLNAL